jgi:hypothetical protein
VRVSDYGGFFSRYFDCFVHEIYPDSETPHLTQVAHLDLYPSDEFRAHLLPGTVILYDIFEDRIVFIVWDYRLNHSISFSVDVDVKKFGFDLGVHFILSKSLKMASNSFVGR